MAMVVKKYSNRRLYDTDASHYITLDELAARIREGVDVRVLDAKTGEDLTQATLTQIILEHKAKLLPVPLLVQLLRMRDDALAEFFGRYMTWALELYMQAKQGAQQISPYNPLATIPFSATNALARMFMGGSPWQQAAPPPPPPPATSRDNDVDELRRELDELKRSMKRPRRRG
jgi:polyhydroxyalkanoate synthesis repressor PhaR